MDTQCLKKDQIESAAEHLRQGRLVAFPTETVYGLGAPVFLPEAIAEIFRVKGRPADNPLIAHLSDLAQVALLAVEIPPLFYTLADHFFPGPLTVVLKRHPQVPAIVSAGLDTIALRMPSHPLAKELIARTGQPLVAPSANISGRPSSTQAAHVLADFQGKIAAVVDGGSTEYGIESTVVSLLGGAVTLLRPGAISRQQLEKVLGFSIAIAQKADGPVISPGMKYRHYSPRAPVHLLTTLPPLIDDPQKRRMLLSRCSVELEFADHYLLSAKELYAHLRHADDAGYEEIWIYCDEEIQNDSALMNRIQRSAGLY